MALDNVVKDLTEKGKTITNNYFKDVIDKIIREMSEDRKPAYIFNNPQIYDFLTDGNNYPTRTVMRGEELIGKDAIVAAAQTYIGFLLNPFPYGHNGSNPSSEQIERSLFDAISKNNLSQCNVLDFSTIFMQNDFFYNISRM